ncbi:hypothetical protein J7M00_03010 [bacterium]|nr:hypothetical protein [bacterium]
MEKIRFEHCPVCGSVRTENIFHIKSGEPPVVFVRCADCGAFVSKYVLSKYTSDKPAEMLNAPPSKFVAPFDDEVKKSYENLQKLLKEQGEDFKLIEQLIGEADK